jgi:exodeoxyribonuclease VII large subunit
MFHHPLSTPKEAPKPLSITEVVEAWDKTLRGMGSVAVVGELTEWTVNPRSGHAYFTLADATCRMRAIMWRNRVDQLRELPQIGAQVVCVGSGSVYPRSGSASFQAVSLLPAGAGAQALALAALRARLEAEGLFAPERRQPLPALPETVGVVTSRSADGFADFLRSRALRAPGIRILLADTAVQGEGAGAGLAAALRRLDRSGRCQVIAVIRGGGSAEDLLPFSDELLVRAIAASGTPVVVGVGHEPDHPLAQFAADRAAHTPTHAAELIFPDLLAERRAVLDLRRRLGRWAKVATRREGADLDTLGYRNRVALDHRLGRARQAAALLDRRLQEAHPLRRLRRDRQTLSGLGERLGRTDPRIGLASLRGRWEFNRAQLDREIERHLGVAQNRLGQLGQRLHAASPLTVLGRGYVLVTDGEGAPRPSAHTLAVGDSVALRFHDGRARVRVEEVDDG